MLPHLPFYEVLATADESLPVWAPTLAGLAVLHLLDDARENPAIVDADWTGVKVTTDSVGALREGSPLRRPLQHILDQLRDGAPSWSGVNKALFAYGRALDLEGHWSLAADVFGTVSVIAREERDAKLVIEATTALGGAARRSGDWDRSAESYAAAAQVADALGDKASGLTIQIGNANTYIARGNLPAARMILDEVVAEAERSGLEAVEALAYHGKSTVAHLSASYAEAVDFGYKALERTTAPASRDSIMADIAAGFAELGLRDAARDAQLVISLTSRYQWVRWQATINLMELAARDGVAGTFESYAKQLKYAALDPRLRSYFLLYYGQGLITLGRQEEGLESIADAREFASRNNIHQVAHEAGAALVEARKVSGSRVPPVAVPGFEIPREVFVVAEAISRLRETALATTSKDDWSDVSRN